MMRCLSFLFAVIAFDRGAFAAGLVVPPGGIALGEVQPGAKPLGTGPEITMYNWSVNMKQHCDTSADGAYADKFLHCYASCEFSQDCGTKVSAALGVIKEIGDIIGHTLGLFKDLLFEDRTTVGEDFEWYWKWIVDGGTDLWADGFGIACSWAGENCKCCCEKSTTNFITEEFWDFL